MVNNKHNVDTKTLVIVLSSLLLVAIALVVAIVFLPMANKRNNDYSEDNLAKECLEAGEDMDLSECLEDKSFSYFEEGDCEKALKVYDDVPVGLVSKVELAHLYDEAYSLSLSCDDESLQNYWMGKNDEISNQLEATD
ncbi:hypothetical protein IJI28_01200 [Candidatus Saccharibacteria bacterium]|nr:hypothetical protein [Candidatus Saccharibacteria bacterium]